MARRQFVRAALLVLLLAAAAVAYLWRDTLNPAALEQWVEQAGIWGPLIFALAYVIATVLLLPGGVLTLAGGALFGPVLGTLLSLTSATIGATLAFAIARYLASDWVARKTSGWTKQLMQGVEAEGWRFVAFVRLVPLLPFNLLNYALGLTRIGLVPYVIASYVFMLPGAIAYTYLGYAGREAMAGGEGAIRKGLIALALLGIAAFLPRLLKRLRRASATRVTAATTLTAAQLKSRLDRGEDIVVLDVRTAADYAADGHIAGARNIPVEELAQRVSELDGLRNQPLAVICRTNRRSGDAVRQLAGHGFSTPLLVEDGMAAWKQQGFPTEKVPAVA